MSEHLDPPDSITAAEKEIADLRMRHAQLCATGDNGDHPEIWNRVFALDKWIAVTAPSTLAEVATKLRRLADPEIGIGVGDAEEDAISVRQMLAFIEAKLTKSSMVGAADGR